MAQLPPIPFVDLRPQHDAIRADLMKRWNEDIDRADFILGKSVREFEEAFRQFIGTKHILAVNSGTDALLIPLRAMGIGPGDEVILPAFTFIATADVVIRLGATPVLVDIDPVTYCTTPKLIADAITPKTKAIIPVHLYGGTCAMDEVMALADKHGIKVIEDAAQATGSHWKGKKVGAWGLAGGFSFYPTKNLGAAGDGGVISTNDDKLADTMKMMRDHGRGPDGLMQVLGYNSRMNSIQASYLLLKLTTLAQQIDQRRETATHYNKRFAGHADIVTPHLDAGHTMNNYTIRLADRTTRDGLRAHMKNVGIGVNVYYDPPCHLQPVMDSYGYELGDFPVSEMASERVLTLPSWPGLSAAQRDRVCDEVLSYVGSHAPARV